MVSVISLFPRLGDIGELTVESRCALLRSDHGVVRGVGATDEFLG